MSPLERKNDRLRNVEIPNRLVHDPDEADQPDADGADGADETVDLAGDVNIDDTAIDETEFDETEFDTDFDGETDDGPSRPGRRGRFSVKVLLRLYRGQTKFDFVGRRRWWFLLSGIIIVAGLVSFSIRGFNFGIDF
ncbi:MAG TPA: hypothetical protein VN793_03355, partial [Acidimicrobiales bacterium]|nr:hypothetical protein [Acidimicrobiales bacterium]